MRGGPTSGMATRSVSKYLGLERALQDALAARDHAAVQRSLDEGFEVRTAASPDPVDAGAWLDRTLGSAAADGVVQDLAVRELDDLALVSFVLQGPVLRKAGAAHGALFIVDVWRQSSGKLLARYVERPAVAPARHTRPTGRE